jgi:hypothetical protein
MYPSPLFQKSVSVSVSPGSQALPPPGAQKWIPQALEISRIFMPCCPQKGSEYVHREGAGIRQRRCCLSSAPAPWERETGRRVRLRPCECAHCLPVLDVRSWSLPACLGIRGALGTATRCPVSDESVPRRDKTRSREGDKAMAEIKAACDDNRVTTAAHLCGCSLNFPGSTSPTRNPVPEL